MYFILFYFSSTKRAVIDSATDVNFFRKQLTHCIHIYTDILF